jgi:tungstate transport system substrate-binding protein
MRATRPETVRARRTARLAAATLLGAWLAAGSGAADPSPAAPSAPPPAAARELIVATTTSAQDSGLLDVLVPDFERRTGYTVKVVAVGTGQALQMGEGGNADVLLVHAPAAEKAFMAAGHGVDRRLVMHNDFVLVGPRADPARVKGLPAAAEALRKIAAAGATFVSRGDDSGTHTAELALWQAAGVRPAPPWYEQSGQGMGPTLIIASEKDAYALADRGTYLALAKRLRLDVLVERDRALLNVYHVITVNPARHAGAPAINATGARLFSDYLTSVDTQAVINRFGADRYGQPLFVGDAHRTDADLGLR